MDFDAIGFLTYACVASFTPGPNTMSTLANAGRVGVRRNLPFALGIMTGVMLIQFACGLVYEQIRGAIPAVKPVMMWAGAAYMLYLAIRIYNSDLSAKRDGRAAGNGFWSGVALEFVNPKLFAYAITVMSTYVVDHFDTWQGIGLCALALGAICMASLQAYAVFGSAILRSLHRCGKAINLLLALALVYCAVSLFL